MATHFSQQEKIDMYNIFVRNYRNATVAARIYGELYPERRRPDPTTFRRLWNRLNRDGTFQNRRVRNEVGTVGEINVLAQIHINPEVSQRKLGMECNLSKSGVQRILKKHKLHDFKFKPVQTLHVGDELRRLNFCRWFRNELAEDPDFFRKILWSDETLFTNAGMFNRRNKHYYATENPHLVREVRPQVRFSVNIWCGLLGDKLIGPFFISRRLTGHSYLRFLQNEFENALENLPLQTIRNFRYFQHDGASPHKARIVRDYLNRRFPNSWIGNNGPVSWPARSPCLNPLDYFLWGFAKNKIYDTPVEGEEHLRAKILDVFEEITPEIILNAVASMDRRTELCIDHAGGHFEQFLK